MDIEEFVLRMMDLSPQIIKGFAHHEHNYLTRGEITLPQFWVLDYLFRHGTSKMGNLAHYLEISPAATTGLIARLINQELVIRKDDAYDRRIVWIELTLKGRDSILSIRKQKMRTLTKVFGKISTVDRVHYLKILERVVKIVESLPRAENRPIRRTPD